MREIKFRAWHFKQARMFSSGEMTEDRMALLPDGHFANISSVNKALTQIMPRDFMLPLQFTGLRDKNGNEIYEGDILAWHHWEGTANQTRWVVEWNENDTRFTMWSPRSEAVVIGNIYENPEFLN